MKRKLQNIAYLLMAAALVTSCGEKKQTAEFPDWAWADFQRPEGINPIISPSIQSTVLAFTFLYAVIAIISILIMMGLGVGFLESIGTVISSMGNMGPGLGTCGPAFSWSELPDAAKWLLSFLMLLGRLELFTVLLLFTSDFWKKN